MMLLPPNVGICLDFDGFSQTGANDNKHHVLTCSMGSIVLKRFGQVTVSSAENIPAQVQQVANSSHDIPKPPKGNVCKLGPL